MTFALLSILMPLILGLVLTMHVWPGQANCNLMTRAMISLGLGLGALSLLFFAWLSAFGGGNGGFLLFEKTLLAALAAYFLHALIKRKIVFALPRRANPAGMGYTVFLKAAFFALLATSVALFVFLYLNSPHGQWDAWAIWNSHARSIFRGEDNWLSLFLNPRSHPDYPLLVPLLVALGWVNTGHETTLVPAAIAFLYVFASILLAWSSLSSLRSKSQGLLAGLVLAGTLFFIKQGTWQYADVPLSFYFLLTLVLFSFFDSQNDHRLLILAGMAAGLSAWTKNEGLLFLVSIVVARALVMIPKKGWRGFSRQTLFFAAGLAPVLVFILYFKVALTPPNDLVSAQGADTFARLVDPSRYFLILKTYAVTAVKFTEGLIGLPLLIVYFFLAGLDGQRDRISSNTLLATLLLMLGGYFLVYLTTPADLTWHLATSLNRLFIQLWPGFVFYFFLTVNTPEGMVGRR